jgi:Tol biopolymer transport system component
MKSNGILHWLIVFALLLVACSYTRTSYCKDGRLIVSNGTELLVLTPSGEQIKTIPNSGYGISVSPDGKYVAFAKYDGLFVLDLENDVSQKILDWSRDEFNPIWSPDGKKLAFAYGVADGDLATYVVNVWDTKKFNKLSPEVEGEIREEPLDWFGEFILLVRGVPYSDTELILARPDGSGRKIIYTAANQEHYDYFRAGISPDGQNAFLEKGFPDTQISLLNLKTLVETNIDTISTGSKSATWSPDGQCIAFLHDTGIYIYSLQTNKVITLPVPSIKYGYVQVIWSIDPEAK